MRLGIGSYAFAWSIGVSGHPPRRPMSACDLLDVTAELGLRVVQICDNLPLHLLEADELDRLERRAADLGIVIEPGARGIAPEHLRTYLDLARRFRSSVVRTLLDAGDRRPTLDEAATTLAPSVAEFAAAGVVLAIENHDRFSARQFAELVERLASPAAGICLDTVNSFGALEGPVAAVDALAPWTASLHVKDFAVRRVEHQMGFAIEGRPAGQGRLDVAWLLERLRAAGRQPNAILELWPPPEATLEATIAKERRWALESVDYLRNLIPD